MIDCSSLSTTSTMPTGVRCMTYKNPTFRPEPVGFSGTGLCKLEPYGAHQVDGKDKLTTAPILPTVHRSHLISSLNLFIRFDPNELWDNGTRTTSHSPRIEFLASTITTAKRYFHGATSLRLPALTTPSNGDSRIRQTRLRQAAIDKNTTRALELSTTSTLERAR